MIQFEGSIITVQSKSRAKNVGFHKRKREGKEEFPKADKKPKEELLLVRMRRRGAYLLPLQNSQRRPWLEKTRRATSTSQRIESSRAFLMSPFLRLEKVTCRLLLSSIRFISSFLLPIIVDRRLAATATATCCSSPPASLSLSLSLCVGYE